MQMSSRTILLLVLLGIFAHGQDVEPISCTFPFQSAEVHIGTTQLCCNFSSLAFYLPSVFIDGTFQSITENLTHNACDILYLVPILQSYDGLEISVQYGTYHSGRWSDTIHVSRQHLPPSVTPQPTGSMETNSPGSGSTTMPTETSTPGSSPPPVVLPCGTGCIIIIGIVVGIVIIIVIILVTILAVLLCRRGYRNGGHPVADGSHPDADGGHPDADGGHPDADGGHPDADGGHPDADGGHPEGGHLNSDGGGRNASSNDASGGSGIAMSDLKKCEEDISCPTEEEGYSSDLSSFCTGSFVLTSLFRGDSERITCFTEKDMVKLTKLKCPPSQNPNTSLDVQSSEEYAVQPVQARLEGSEETSELVLGTAYTLLPYEDLGTSDVLKDSKHVVLETPDTAQSVDESHSIEEELSSDNIAPPVEDMDVDFTTPDTAQSVDESHSIEEELSSDNIAPPVEEMGGSFALRTMDAHQLLSKPHCLDNDLLSLKDPTVAKALVALLSNGILKRSGLCFKNSTPSRTWKKHARMKKGHLRRCLQTSNYSLVSR